MLGLLYENIDYQEQIMDMSLRKWLKSIVK